jgi:hypothetical protein
MAWNRILPYWKPVLGVLIGAGFIIAIGTAWLIGLFSIERHQGYFAPIWDRDGQHILLIQRETFGIVWGLGWEHFSPPASTYVISDRLSLRRFDTRTGKQEVLEDLHGSPVQGRVTRHYRGRIFNFISARVVPTEHGLEFAVAMNVPRVPTSEQWALKGRWTSDRASGARWAAEWAGNTAPPDAVLRDGVELITVKGREGFPAAVLSLGRDGGYRVVLKTDAFAKLYPDGVPARQIAEASNRSRIERGREIRRVNKEQVARYMAMGMNDGEAQLRANDALEELGYRPKGPRLVATVLGETPDDLRVFDIPAERYRVGLFSDIAKAIARPGAEVKTGTGTYLKYYDDETGPLLKSWRRAGNDRFAVRTGDTLYLLEVRRSEPDT